MEVTHPLTSTRLPPSAGHNAYRHAFKAHPLTWYERKWLITLLSFPLTAGGWWLQTALHAFPNLRLSLAGLTIHLLGYSYDTFATHSTLQLKRQFDQHGLDFPLTETSPLLPNHPTLNDLLFGKNTLLILLLFSAGFFFPSFGLAAGLGHFLAGRANLNQKQRLQLGLKSLNL